MWAEMKNASAAPIAVLAKVALREYADHHDRDDIDFDIVTITTTTTILVTTTRMTTLTRALAISCRTT